MADKSLPGKGIGRDWFTFAEFNLALSKALLNITEKAGCLRSGTQVTIRVLISEPVPVILEADITLDQDSGIERAARAAPRGWGFFLVDGYTGGNPESGNAAIPFIDLFLYLEGERGG